MRPALRFISVIALVLSFSVAATAVAAPASPVSIAKKKKKKHYTEYTNPKLAPTHGAGLFDGYPTYSDMWHGCSKQAIYTLDTDVSILPSAGVTEGNAQKAVTFTPAAGFTVGWQVNPGWKICGAMANGTLSNPNVKDLLLADFGFTSSSTTGTSSAATGIKVPIPKNAINRKDYKEFEGKTYSINEVVDVIVYVKKG